jgi:hypothetical protein
VGDKMQRMTWPNMPEVTKEMMAKGAKEDCVKRLNGVKPNPAQLDWVQPSRIPPGVKY